MSFQSCLGKEPAWLSIFSMAGCSRYKSLWSFRIRLYTIIKRKSSCKIKIFFVTWALLAFSSSLEGSQYSWLIDSLVCEAWWCLKFLDIKRMDSNSKGGMKVYCPFCHTGLPSYFAYMDHLQSTPCGIRQQSFNQPAMLAANHCIPLTTPSPHFYQQQPPRHHRPQMNTNPRHYGVYYGPSYHHPMPMQR